MFAIVYCYTFHLMKILRYCCIISFKYPFGWGLNTTFILISFVYFKAFIEFKHVCTCLNSTICYNRQLIILIWRDGIYNNGENITKKSYFLGSLHCLNRTGNHSCVSMFESIVDVMMFPVTKSGRTSYQSKLKSLYVCVYLYTHTHTHMCMHWWSQ